MTGSEKQFLRDYTTPPHPSAFGGVGKLRQLYPNVSETELRRRLSAVDAYTRHKEAKPVSLHNPVIVRYRLQLLQLDLLNVTRFKNENDGVAYLLMIIDTFSRRAWALPLRNKQGSSAAAAFRTFLQNELSEEQRRRVERVLTDRGKEFTSGEFQNVLKEAGIQFSHPKRHAPHVERLVRSFKRILYSFVTERDDPRYLDALPDLVATYNARPHAAHGLAPERAFAKANARRVNYALAARQEKQLDTKKQPLRFNVGDYVRRRVEPDPRKAFARSFDVTHRQELYRVHAVIRGPLPVPTYKLAGLRGGIVPGTFYANELTRVRPGKRTFRIDKIKDRRVRRGRREALVSYQGYDDLYDAWVPEEEAERATTH